MARRIEISKLLAPCLLILVALQLFESKTSVSADSNLKDVYAGYSQMDDGDFTEMDYFDERLDTSDIDRHGSKHRRFKLRNKHKKKKYNYGASSQFSPVNYYQSPTTHKRPLGGKYSVPKTQSIVTPPKYRAPHHPPTRHQVAIPAASRPLVFKQPASRPLTHRHPAPHPPPSSPRAPHPHASHSSALHPAASRPSASQFPISRPTPSRPTPSHPSTSRPTPSRPSTPRPAPSRTATTTPKPSRSTSSSQTFSHFELPLLPLSHPVLFGPEGLRSHTSRPKVSKSPTRSSSSSQTTTSRYPTKRSSTSRPPTSQTPVSYSPTSTTLATSTTVYTPTSSTTTSSSTYSSTQTSSPSESTAPTYIPTATNATESSFLASSAPEAKKSHSKKKSTVSSLSTPEDGTLELTQEIPINPVDIPKATSFSSASVSNKDDTGFFFRPTNSFPNFFKQLLQG